MKKIAIVFVPVLLLAGWLAWSRMHGVTARDEGAIPARYLAKAEKRDIDATVELTGDVMPDTQLDVKAEVGGKIKALHVEPGQEVKKGELLVEVDDTDLLTQKASASTDIAGAKIGVEKSRRNFERGKSLFAAKLINQEAFDNLSADYQTALNDLEKTQRRLDQVEDSLRKTKILAAGDGTVLSVPVIEGQVVIPAASVNSGTTLMSIADLSRLLVDTNVNQVDVTKLHLNQKVSLRTDAIKDLAVEAVVNFIAPVASTKNNVKGFEIKALIEHPDPRLRPGMTVNISVPIASAPEVVAVPISAVFKGSDADSRIVYIRRGDSTEKREVKVGVTNLEYAEIKSGVQPGEEILLVEPRVLGNKT